MKRKQNTDSTEKPKNRRSQTCSFDYRLNCIFCGKPDKYEGRKQDHKLRQIRTLNFKKNVMDVCDRRKDSWSELVRGRIEYVQDLPAADAVYHEQCSSNFRTDKNMKSFLL